MNGYRIQNQSGTTLAYLIAVDAVNTLSIDAGVVDAVVVVLLAVLSPCSRQTSAFVAVGTIDTYASVLTRIGHAFVDGTIAKISTVTRMAIALEGTDASDTIAMNTRIIVELALVFVDFTTMTGKTGAAIASKSRIKGISASATIHARIVVARSLYCLASFSSKAYGTCASETIDEVCANASILARIGAAFIDIRLAMTTRET